MKTTEEQRRRWRSVVDNYMLGLSSIWSMKWSDMLLVLDDADRCAELETKIALLEKSVFDAPLVIESITKAGAQLLAERGCFMVIDSVDAAEKLRVLAERIRELEAEPEPPLFVEVELPAEVVRGDPPRPSRDINIRHIGSDWTHEFHHPSDFVWVKVPVKGSESECPECETNAPEICRRCYDSALEEAARLEQENKALHKEVVNLSPTFRFVSAPPSQETIDKLNEFFESEHSRHLIAVVSDTTKPKDD